MLTAGKIIIYVNEIEKKNSFAIRFVAFVFGGKTIDF